MDFENLTGFENTGPEPWDAELAGDLVGSTLLVGLTYLTAEGEITRRVQIFGRVVSCTEADGITIQSDSQTEPFNIAPVLEAISPAAPGIYQMRDSDLVVENPDFVARITVQAPSLS